jgi:hypothetical protein
MGEMGVRSIGIIEALPLYINLNFFDLQDVMNNNVHKNDELSRLL